MDRDYRMDNTKLFFIFCVVFGHLIEPLRDKNEYIRIIWQFLHVIGIPLFAFISGFYIKAVPSDNWYIQNIKTILIPFILFDIIYELLHVLLFNELSYYIRQLAPYWLMWFLFSLFIWKTLLYQMISIKYILIISYIFALLIGFADEAGLTLSVSRTVYFLPFFLLGFYSNKIKVLEIIKSKFLIPAFAIIIFIFIIYFLSIKEIHSGLLLGTTSYHNLNISSINGLIWRSVLMLTSTISVFLIILIMPKTKLTITKIGENTLYIYLLHGIPVRIIKATNITEYLGTNTSLFLISNIIFALLLVALFGNKYTKYILDKLFHKINSLILKS
jgi:fucose 4-O-acetylase-like acetyltransferase